jgi:ABC-type Mn2+/Zn2+ transport system ATPase subunit
MRPVIAATDLIVRFGSHTAIDRSSFQIPAGVVAAVIGPNGSGKSTLLNVIAGLVRPTAGDIDIAVDRDRIAYVMQATKVNENLPVTVGEVVAMGRYASLGPYGRTGAVDRGAVTEAMGRMEIAPLARRHLHDLSGGQRQRVFVAQGLAQEHDVLLLDEPLTGIDLTTAQAIDEVIHAETRDGCTVIMTTHDLTEARTADYVVLLAGRVVAAGPPESVLVEENLIAAYGPALLHVEKGRLFLDDPAHAPVPGRHTHQERSIHTETDRGGVHGT